MTTMGQQLPILVYSMGKVASSSIYHTLRKNHDMEVFHVHHLHAHENHQGELIGHKLQEKTSYHRFIETDKNPAKVITLVREPISRNISAFFQNTARHMKFGAGIENFNILEADVEDLLTAYFEYFRGHKIPTRWFTSEFEEKLGINVYQHDFPIEKGYIVIPDKRFETLLLRAEISDDIKTQAIRNFLNLSDFELRNFNVGSKKPYAEIYREFKNRITFDQDYLDKMYKSQYMQHFYTVDEIQKFREKWSV